MTSKREEEEKRRAYRIALVRPEISSRRTIPFKWISGFIFSLGISTLAHGAAPSPSLPSPPYPEKAQQEGWKGTTTVSVHFAADGTVSSCDVVKSSGSKFLDRNAVLFIRKHWVAAEYAGKSFQIPIVYQPPASPHRESNRPDKTSLEDLLVKDGFTAVPIDSRIGNKARVEVTINGHRISLFIDTGALSTVFTPRAAARCDLPVQKYLPSSGSGLTGKVEGKAGLLTVPNMVVAGRTLALVPVVSQAIKMGRIDGLFGIDLLKANHAIIVVNPPLLLVNPERPASSGFHQWLAQRNFSEVPLSSFHGWLVAPMHLNGLAVRMILDTGCGLSLVSGGFVVQHKLRYVGFPLQVGGVNGERVPTGAVFFSQVSAGDFSLGPQGMTTIGMRFKPDGIQPVMGGLLGFDLLAGETSVIDTAASRLYLHAP